MYGVLFQIEAQLSLKNAWLPPISFWIPRSVAKFFLFEPRKNIAVLISNSNRKPEYLEMCRTYAQ